MSRPIAVLRPEPGNRTTAEAIAAAGGTALRLPLFEIRALPWQAPDPAAFDALILTSANAVRHAGPALEGLRRLPVHAVGAATARAARAAGLTVAATGSADAASLLAAAEAGGVRRALHLAGREHTLSAGGIVAAIVPVYASDAIPLPLDRVAGLAGSIALVQSARAGARLAEIVEQGRIDRSGIAIVAVSPRAAAAAGPGWEREVAPRDFSAAGLIAAAIALAD